MSFIEAYYNFSVDFTDSERDLYVKLNFKLAKHPDESPQHVTARALTYLHAYSPVIKLSPGYFEPEEPSLFEKNSLDEITSWIDIGNTNAKRLKRVLKLPAIKGITQYFYSTEQIEKFCKELRGSTDNWVNSVNLYSFEESQIEALSSLLELKNSWVVVMQDNQLYLSFDYNEIQLEVTSLNIWEYYQKTIGNIAITTSK